MSNLILDIDDHYSRRVSQRESAALANIKAKFNAVGLKERQKPVPSCNSSLLLNLSSLDRLFISFYLESLGPTTRLRCSF